MSIVVVGLGNIGAEYVQTRHNAGRMAVELFAKEYGEEDFSLRKTSHARVATGSVAGKKVTCVLPETFMNVSGKAVTSFIKSPKMGKNLIVVHDDLDLPLGTVKISFGKNSGGHKGGESVMRAIKTKKFTRVRIGISGKTSRGNAKKPSGDAKVVKYVVGSFSPSEKLVLKKALKKAVQGITLLITEGLEKAMLEVHTK